jgi:hypothetical protein
LSPGALLLLSASRLVRAIDGIPGADPTITWPKDENPTSTAACESEAAEQVDNRDWLVAFTWLRIAKNLR